VAIETICSSCETRFTVQDDLLGRPMRCPECREVFVVRAAATLQSPPLKAEGGPAPPSQTNATRSDPPAPKYETGSIADFLSVLSSEEPLEPVVESPHAIRAEEASFPELAEKKLFSDFEVVEETPSPVKTSAPPVTSPPQDKQAKPMAAPSAKKKKPIEFEVVEPQPVEVKWSPDLAPPPPRRGATTPTTQLEQQVEEDEPVEEEPEEVQEDEPDDVKPVRRYRTEKADRPSRPRRRKKKSRFVLMFVLLTVIVGGVGIGGFLLMRHMQRAPERLYEQAKKEYDANNYEPARKLYEELARDYPKHQRAAEARFFVELCSLRLAVGSVTVRADPGPAQAQLDKFLKATDSPQMQAFLETGKFNVDLWQATKKLCEDITGKGTDVFNLESPDESEKWLLQAEAVGAVVDRFRPKETERESVYQDMAVLRRQIDGARTRTRLLTDAKTRLASADDRTIEEVRIDAQNQTYYLSKQAPNARLFDDAAFKQLLADAEKTIQARVGYVRFETPIPPTPVRGGSGAGLLFAPRVDPPDPNRIPAPFGPTSVFFALARGVLYALEDPDGRVLWATRVGIDGDSLPLQLPGNDLHPELVLVVSNDGAQSGLTARLARTGEAVWHQSLSAPVIGRPVLVGQRVFVPLSESLKPAADNANPPEFGVVLEIEIANGNVLGKIVLGRPLGGSAARRPGTGHLFFPAEAKGVYVFDVERIGPDGTRVDPTYLGILTTDHASGTLRGEPVITAGDANTPSFLILSLTDGLEAMKLRAFPLTPADQPPAIQGELPPPIALAGWSWFPPYCDTEKLAVVTDRGEFGLFGIKQAGNLDVPLFVLPPTPYLLPDIRVPARGQIVYADEHDFWFLARGLLYHLKIGFDAERGIRLVPRGEPIPIGEPLQPAQVNVRGDFAMVVTQASATASCRATAIDLRIGKIRWQRQLGLIAQGDALRVGNSIMMMDHDGGLYQIDAEPLSRLADASWLIEEKWLVARPVNDVVEASQFVAGTDNSVYAVLTTRTAAGARIVVRRFVPGQPIEERTATLSAPLAGNVIVLGKQIIVPLANGMLVRMNLATDRQLEPGPTWRGERVSTQAVCHLTAISDSDFLATDGSRSLNRWRWAGDQEDFSRRGELVLADRIAAAPVVFSDGGGLRVFVIDIRNNATLWDADRLTTTNQTPIRAWRSGEKGVLPSGAVTNGPTLARDPNGKPHLTFVVDKLNVAWLDPASPAPIWIVKPKEIAPDDGVIGKLVVVGSRLYLTCRSGKCISLDLKQGESRQEPIKLRGSTVPAAATVVLDNLLLVPLSDGTVLLEWTGPKPAAKLPVLLLPIPPLGAVLPLPLELN
jgi:PQQ-like domain